MTRAKINEILACIATLALSIGIGCILGISIVQDLNPNCSTPKLTAEK